MGTRTHRSVRAIRRLIAAKGGTVAFVVIMLVMAGALLWPGIFLLVQRQTGVPARAIVGDCELTGAGRFQQAHCTGTWIVGGSLVDGGRVVFGSIVGAEPSEIGKTIDVTLRGDDAYTRDLAQPLGLIGLGLIPVVAAAVLLARASARSVSSAGG